MIDDKKQERTGCCGSKATTKKNNNENLNTITNDDQIKNTVRNQYASIATQDKFTNDNLETEKTNKQCINDHHPHYSKEELESLPDGANLGLGSGNPITHSRIMKGETIIDLGSGAGVDCFLASKKTGKTGKVLGIDMTHEMIYKARKNAQDDDYQNVEFRLGEIENLPVADNFADVIVSNCVINLSTDKERVFQEAYRVLKPGGRIIVSDIMLNNELPEIVSKAMNSQCGCVSRAILVEDYQESIKKAGFESIEVIDRNIIAPKNKLEEFETEKVKIKLNIEGSVLEIEMSREEYEQLSNSIMTAHIRAIKPLI